MFRRGALTLTSGITFTFVAIVAGCTAPNATSYSPTQSQSGPAEEFRYVPESPPPQKNKMQIAFDGTHRDWDPYTATETISSPLLRPRSLYNEDRYYCNLGRITKKEETSYIMLLSYVAPVSDGFLGLNSAHDRHARSFPVVPRGVPEFDSTNERVIEMVAIIFDRTYLADAANGEGFDLRIDGNRGNCQVVLDAESIKGFLKKVDAIDAKASSQPSK